MLAKSLSESCFTLLQINIAMLHIAIINGPNLNLLGTREPHLYGRVSFEAYLDTLRAAHRDIAIAYFQSNVEGELINFLHACRGKMHGILLNAGAYTHTSIALADAVSAIEIPVLEIHISNVLGREDFRKTSYIAARCVGGISGLGLEGYNLGILYFKQAFG
jgi:3-dehydroquinate dehydratase-2